MNTPYRPSLDPLFGIERRIARRADELTRCNGTDPTQALAAWRQAESEVWADAALVDSPAFKLGNVDSPA
jgi:hypothetical protein